MTLKEKIQNNIQLTLDEALELYNWDLVELGLLASSIREEKFQRKTLLI